MKEELKQLEDPPITAQEKEISSKRLGYSFYDIPCKDLAQKLLGKDIKFSSSLIILSLIH